MTFSSYYAHTSPNFKDLAILTNDKLILHRIGITIYKYSYGLLPDVFNTLDIKNSEIHTYSTRSIDLYILPGTQTFSNISAKIWNSLTVNINVNLAFIKIKESLKLYLLNNTFLLTTLNNHYCYDKAVFMQLLTIFINYLCKSHVHRIFVVHVVHIIHILIVTPVNEIV